MDGVMFPEPSLVPGPPSSDHKSRMPVEQHQAPAADLLDDVISHIDRARLLIRTCCAGAKPALVHELDDISDDLDAAMGRLRSAAGTGHQALAVTPFPGLPFIHLAWSEEEDRWISMTFHENQAWLARPDLDPREFAFHEAMR